MTMSYETPSHPSAKEWLDRYNRIQLQNFKLDKNKKELKLYPISKLPGRAAKSKPIIYTKETVKCGESTIDIIKKNEEFDSFVWHTTSDKVKEAVKWGIVKTQSVTGQVIAALGKYRLTVLDRIEDDAGISNRYIFKEPLLTHYQDRFEALEELESLANRQATYDEFNEAFKHYIDKLNKLEQGLFKPFPEEFKDVDHQGIAHIRKEIKLDIERAEHFMDHYNFTPANRATGIDSILTFVKKEMARNLRNLQNHNQNITYSRKNRFALTRGDLNSFIEDAEKIIEDYNAPPRDAIWSDHHGCYGLGNGKVAYDSSDHCSSPQEEHRAALAVTFIEKMNEIDVQKVSVPGKTKPTTKVFLKRDLGNPIELKIIAATKWRVGGGPVVGMKRACAWAANIAIKIGMGVVELPLTLIVEPLLFGHGRSFFNKVRKFAATSAINIERSTPEFSGTNELLQKVKRPPKSLGLRLRHLAVNAFKNTFQDAFFGVHDVYKQFTVHLFDDILDDYADGAKHIPDLDTVIKNCKNELIKIARKEMEIKETLQAQLNGKIIFESLHEEKEEGLSEQEQFARPGFIPSAGEYHDALNAGADGLDKFMAFFLHNIHAKHPFAGLLFSLTYVAGGLAVLVPNYVAFLGAEYIAFCKAMGFSMSKSHVSAAVSSAVTQAQLVTAAYEFGLHGPKSWLATNAKGFEQDPFTSLIYIGTAMGFGYLVINQFHIPWLSEMLKEDMGTFPPTSWAFIGAKLGVLVYELLSEHSRENLAQTERGKELREFLIKIRTRYKEAKEKQGINIDENIEEKVDASLKQFLTAEKMEKFKDAYDKLQGDDKFKQVSKETKELVDKQLTRNRIINFLANSKEQLPYLSARTKHQVVQQLKEHFPFHEARSLKKMLYPEETMSILRTTLKIIVTYPAFLVRMGAAVVSSLAQLSIKPLQSASMDFGLKILKDLSRVSRAIGKIFKVHYNFFRRHLKTFADVFVNSILARSQAVIANRHGIANIGYYISGAEAAINENNRQFVSTPGDELIKSATIPHPLNTERGNDCSYRHMLDELVYKQNLSIDSVKQSAAPVKNVVSFDKSKQSVRGRHKEILEPKRLRM